MQWVGAFNEQLEHVRLPSVTPPDGELVLSATDMSYAGDDTPRASYPSPRLRTTSCSPTRRHIPAGGK
eukprot:12917161-Prorocentrum_lima.AAC.1